MIFSHSKEHTFYRTYVCRTYFRWYCRHILPNICSVKYFYLTSFVFPFRLKVSKPCESFETKLNIIKSFETFVLFRNLRNSTKLYYILYIRNITKLLIVRIISSHFSYFIQFPQLPTLHLIHFCAIC